MIQRRWIRHQAYMPELLTTNLQLAMTIPITATPQTKQQQKRQQHIFDGIKPLQSK